MKRPTNPRRRLPRLKRRLLKRKLRRLNRPLKPRLRLLQQPLSHNSSSRITQLLWPLSSSRNSKQPLKRS